LEESMIEAANNLEFEKAALFRDQINELKRSTSGASPDKPVLSSTAKPVSYRKAKKSRVGR